MPLYSCWGWGKVPPDRAVSGVFFRDPPSAPEKSVDASCTAVVQEDGRRVEKSEGGAPPPGKGGGRERGPVRVGEGESPLPGGRDAGEAPLLGGKDSSAGAGEGLVRSGRPSPSPVQSSPPAKRPLSQAGGGRRWAADSPGRRWLPRASLRDGARDPSAPLGGSLLAGVGGSFHVGRAPDSDGEISSGGAFLRGFSEGGVSAPSPQVWDGEAEAAPRLFPEGAPSSSSSSSSPSFSSSSLLLPPPQGGLRRPRRRRPPRAVALSPVLPASLSGASGGGCPAEAS